MLLRWVRFLFISVGLARGGEIFDVTTVYDLETLCEDSNKYEGNSESAWDPMLGDNLDTTTPLMPVRPSLETPKPYCVTGRVHVLSNAMGIPLVLDKNNTVLEYQQNLNDITCDLANDKCPWVGKGWNIENEGVNITRGKRYKLQHGVRISFQKIQHDYDDEFLLYFLSETTIGDESVQYLIRFNLNNVIQINLYHQLLSSYYYACGGSYRDNHFVVKNHEDEDEVIYCQERSNLEIDYPYGSLSFSFTNNIIEIFDTETSPPKVVMNWTDPTGSKDIKYFAMSGDNLKDSGATLEVPVYTSSSAGSELESGPVATADTRLCLALTVHSPVDHAGDLLAVSAHDLSGQVTHSQRHLYDFKSGWNHKQVQLTFGGSINEEFKLKIRTTTPIQTKILRISTCNPDGEDVVRLPTKNVSPQFNFRYNMPPNIYTAASLADAFEPVERRDVYNKTLFSTSVNEEIACLNGGALTRAGCNCRPGFSGVNCQLGCGRNKFGRECGVACSLRNRECRGLLLCTEATRCGCAPGYRGRRCEYVCDGGTYGNDCLQRCGNCADHNACDVYTGKCLACQPGYKSPYCNQPHVYYASKPEVSTHDFGMIQVNFDPTNYISEDEAPELYQIQYKERDGAWKISTTKSVNESDSYGGKRIEKIDGLKAGHFYKVRVLLMDSNFHKYDGPLVQTSEILTKCNIPDVYDYHVRFVSNTSSFTFFWEYENTTANWCPVSSYEVSWKEMWEWYSLTVDSNRFSLTDFRPGSTIGFKVRAKTVAGFAPDSSTISASTLRNGTSGLTNLWVVSTRSTAVTLAWSPPPDDTLDQRVTYTIMYKCVDQPACSPGCVNATEGTLSQQDTIVTLSSLLPFTRYQVSVTPENGPESRIFVGTSKVTPTEKPLLSEKNKIERTNNSLTVFWDPVLVCSGFKLGYNYQLAKESEPLKVVVGGFTRDTSFTFHNLSASTAYVIKVYIVTVAGRNPDSYLEIKTSTTATVPDCVRQLTVYKRGRSALGLRWAAPRTIYGTLKSYTVSHTPVGGGSAIGQSLSVEPEHCSVWPELYCYTVEGLRANRKYDLSVSARNSEVAEDGVKASVSATTKEGPPSAPVGLRMSNTSDTSVGLQWEHPDLANGQLRSFVVSVEETERVDQDACCQVYPLIETTVTEERRTYETEVSGLQPAATYYVSVSAKTVGLGPAHSLVVHTRPPHAPLTVLPALNGLDLLSWQRSLSPPPSKNWQVYGPLFKVRLLLAVMNETSENGSGIFDSQLDTLLRENIGSPFVFIAEYTEGDAVVDLMDYGDVTDSEWGRRPADLASVISPSSMEELTSSGIQRLVAAQIAEYAGVYNADLVMAVPASTLIQ